MFTKDVEYHIGKPASAMTGPVIDLPAHWAAYLDADQPRRVANLTTDLALLSRIMPKTCASLRKRVRDAFLVKDDGGVLRVLNAEIEDGETLYSYMSQLPRGVGPDIPADFFKNAPRPFADLYSQHFDGLFDASMTGVLPFDQMRPLSEVIDEYGDYPWYDQLRAISRPDRIVEIFSSGGGGYLYLDLNLSQQDTADPVCILLMNDPKEPPEVLPFWEYLDAWTAISMGE